MFKRILAYIRKIKYLWSKEHCYDQKEDEGYAVMGCCGGMVGGDQTTEYLNYACVDCPHYRRA